MGVACRSWSPRRPATPLRWKTNRWHPLCQLSERFWLVCDGRPGFGADPQYQTEDLDTSFSANPWGNYTYNALQVQLNKRFGSGLSVLSNYVWSKNITDADSDYAPQEAWNGGVGGMFDPYDPRKEKTYSEFDQPQQFKIAYTYELPFGKGKKWGGNVNKLTDAAIGGWTLGGVDTYATGFPLFVQENNWTAGTFAGQATGGNARPNVVPGTNPSAFFGKLGDVQIWNDCQDQRCRFHPGAELYVWKRS